jgi:hypothetical protein
MTGMKLKLKQVTSNGWKFEHQLIVTHFHNRFNEALALMDEGYSDKSDDFVKELM